MSVHEACGVFGIFSPNKVNAAELVYYGLYALQHRGQESCGIVVNHDRNFYSYKDVGLVNDVFSQDVLSDFPMGTMAVGHVRYGTTGGSTRANCQPIEINHLKGRMALAHNGNLSNSYKLRSTLELAGAIFHTTSDTETIAYMITKERLQTASIEEAVSCAMDKLEGAYSLIVMSSTKLIAVRDPYGFRPLCYGIMSDGSYVVASETCALQAVGASFVRDILPGEILTFSRTGIHSDTSHCEKNPKKICIFEYIYFARPDSVLDGVSVHGARLRAGQILADTYPVEADVVIGVPDSGLAAALGYAQKSGIPYGIGFAKNKYIARTFIAPQQQERVDKVKIKLSPISQTVHGKRVVLVDDSIVRGTTSRHIVKLLRDAGATEVHVRISAPPFLYPCYYGTDIDSKENLIACYLTVPEIAEKIGADSIGYLPLNALPLLVGGCEYCAACFNGLYPTAVPEHEKNIYETM